MRRATVTIPDELEAELDRYLESQRPTPSLTAILQTALEQFLREQKLHTRGYVPSRGSLCITPAPSRSPKDGELSDVSVEHDRHLVEAVSALAATPPEPIEP